MLRFYLSRIVLPEKLVEDEDIVQSHISLFESVRNASHFSLSSVCNRCCMKLIHVDIRTNKGELTDRLSVPFSCCVSLYAPLGCCHARMSYFTTGTLMVQNRER